MLNLDKVSVSLGNRQILQEVSACLRTGKLTVLLGKNGSGKSTLAACITQQLPYTGSILLNGQDVASLTNAMRAKQIAYLPQNLPSAGVSVYQLVQMGRSPYIGLTRRLSGQDHAAIQEALVCTGMQDFVNRRVDSLSGGERQKVFLAMLLAQQTPFLVLDEPTAYMDIGGEERFLQLLKALTEKGKTVLTILHNINAACRYADDVMLLDNGCSTFVGTVEQCLRDKAIERAFGVRSISVEDKPFFLAERR